MKGLIKDPSPLSRGKRTPSIACEYCIQLLFGGKE